MIQKLEISGVHLEVGDDLRKYVVKKIGHLDKYVPKHARESAHAEVRLKENNTKNKNERTCEVVLYLPKEVLALTETTINIYAAIDIVEEKLKTRLHKYKELHAGPGMHSRVLAKFKRGENLVP